MRELIELWKRTLGEPPAEQQFVIWTESYKADIVRRAILKTATKNQTLGGMMSQDHRIRFASKCMITLAEQAAEHAANRARLQAEMSEGR
jgi:hypothetical protein